MMLHLGHTKVSTSLTIVRSPAAVGIGVANSISAQASRPDAESEEGWVHFCITAAQEAHAAVLGDPPLLKGGDGSDWAEKHPAQAMLQEWDREHAINDDVDTPPLGPEYLVGEALDAAARQAAQTAFVMCLPVLTNKRRIRALIACVAAGLSRGFMSGKDAKALLYTAQLALAAHPTRRANRTRKA